MAEPSGPSQFRAWPEGADGGKPDPVFEDRKRARTVEPGQADAARVGEELREARLAFGLELRDVAAQLRIRRHYLQALEEGRLKELPSPAHAYGFVRNYAKLLGMDADDQVRRFRDAASGVVVRRSDLVFPEPVPERGFPTGVALLLGAVIMLGGYVAWYNWGGQGERIVDAVPEVPQRLATAVENGEGLRAPASAGDAPAVVPPPRPAPLPVEMPPPPAPEPAAPAEPPPPPQLVLRFRGDAWTEVRDTLNNRVLLSRIMRSGESWAVPQQDGLLLSTGNGGAMDVFVDGELSPVSAQIRGVRRNIPLIPQDFVPPEEAEQR